MTSGTPHSGQGQGSPVSLWGCSHCAGLPSNCCPGDPWHGAASISRAPPAALGGESTAWSMWGSLRDGWGAGRKDHTLHTLPGHYSVLVFQGSTGLSSGQPVLLTGRPAGRVGSAPILTVATYSHACCRCVLPGLRDVA